MKVAILRPDDYDMVGGRHSDVAASLPKNSAIILSYYCPPGNATFMDFDGRQMRAWLCDMDESVRALENQN